MTEARNTLGDTIPHKDSPTFYFVGVTTKQSSIMKIFPLWMKELGQPEVVIEGVDLALDDTPERYREVVAQIKGDPNSLGGLVTTHKINLLNAAADLFEYLDPYATLLREVSSISKQDGRLEGHAKDPISSGKTLDGLLGDGYFGRTGGEVLCLGAGGAGTAIALHLCSKTDPSDRPDRVIVTDTNQERLDHLRQIIAATQTRIAFQYMLVDSAKDADRLMEVLPAGSLVINATGLGKDRPGSPITDACRFPQNGTVWELNYRGELDFMQQALRQKDARHLHVEDGWIYFLHGWTQVISQVLHTPIEGGLFDRLGAIASETR